MDQGIRDQLEKKTDLNLYHQGIRDGFVDGFNFGAYRVVELLGSHDPENGLTSTYQIGYTEGAFEGQKEYRKVQRKQREYRKFTR